MKNPKKQKTNLLKHTVIPLKELLSLTKQSYPRRSSCENAKSLQVYSNFNLTAYHYKYSGKRKYFSVQ